MPHLTTHITKGWIEIRGPAGIVYDGPLDLSSKQRTKVEIDWIHEKTGLDRPSLYDAIRSYKATKRAP